MGSDFLSRLWDEARRAGHPPSPKIFGIGNFQEQVNVPSEDGVVVLQNHEIHESSSPKASPS
jgi:hypothetical protein